jgi:hypothetical protein
VEQIREATRWLRFHVDYDSAYVKWLFQELDAVDVRGKPVRCLVRYRKGRVADWYVYYLKPGAVAQVLQVAAASDDVGMVLDHLHNAATWAWSPCAPGSSRRSSGSCSHAAAFPPHRVGAGAHEQQAVLAMLGSPQSLLTRLDGEWRMGHHLQWREPPVRRCARRPSPAEAT